MFDLKKVNSVNQNDSRGPTYEWKFTDKRQITILVRSKGSKLADHFHTGEDPSKNPERFFMVKGKMKAVFTDQEGEKKEEILEAPGTLKIYPYVLHSMIVLEDLILIEYRITHFDKENPDVFSSEFLTRQEV